VAPLRPPSRNRPRSLAAQAIRSPRRPPPEAPCSRSPSAPLHNLLRAPWSLPRPSFSLCGPPSFLVAKSAGPPSVPPRRLAAPDLPAAATEPLSLAPIQALSALRMLQGGRCAGAPPSFDGAHQRGRTFPVFAG
jgi:hypothetical protein